jgi:hypothetical protein
MSFAVSRRTVRWAPRGSWFVLLTVCACGGRESSSAQGSGTSVGSGASVGDVGSVGATAPSGSASGVGTPDATVAPTDSSLSEGEGGSIEEVQYDSSAGDADVTVVASEGGEASVGACCGQPEPACAAGVCCVASDCPSAERCLDHTCQSVKCAPVQDSTYYIDPSAGIDSASSTGAANCPFRSLTHTLSVIGLDAGAGVTIEIINDGFAPVLSASTGEVFPVQPPANVTIIAEDTTKNLPVLQSDGQVGPVLPPSFFYLASQGCRVSHLIVDGSGGTLNEGFLVEGHGNSIDHVTVQNTSTGIGVSSGDLSLGPGVVVRNNANFGLFLQGVSTVAIQGGRGSEHTSFSANGESGIVVLNTSAVTIQGTNIDPARPDQSDVDADNNGAGLRIGQGGPDIELPVNVVQGLHASGNTNGIEVLSCTRLRLRGSYVGDDHQSGLVVLPVLAGFGNTCWPEDVGKIDLGNPTGPDYGRNIFQAPDAGSATNLSGAICLNGPVPGYQPSTLPAVLAAGNVFGNTDCAVGGTLTRSAACSGQVDIGGISPDGGAAIDVSNCR